MTKNNNTQITDILNNIYNLIVNPETTEKERKLLVTFKNEIEVGKKDNDELLAELRRAIQGLAVRNLSKGISLSSGVSELSKTLTEFQDKSERNINLARGLSSSLVMLIR
ncbi:bacteriocin immunity protein [uncultured Streptococcus sp.]|uniref:bacteriocin immunity protein n=1 Tax=uncultured Streptococcus sp. TaxID=83427 RepID=UPI002599A50A|nr:bacteriocin immunity protein [uncultured Streptococcus sp.]